MMPSVTKHREDFNRFLSVKNMSEEGLEHDHITRGDEWPFKNVESRQI